VQSDWWSFRVRRATYVPLTDRDYEVRRDARYRVGRWLGQDVYGRGFLTLAWIIDISFPIALVAGWASHDFAPRAYVGLAIMITLGLLGIYAHRFWARQDRSENARGYSFYLVKDEPDPEARLAREVILDRGTSDADRQQAVDVLVSKGLCSVPGQPPPPRPRRRRILAR
jgi:hypothetical protein